MASTYVNDLRLNEMATGDQSGSWGTVTNTNLELIAEAFSFGTEGITTNANTHTTTIADGATDPGRSMFLKYTGTLDSACTITIAPNTVSKLWFIENATSGSQNIIIKQGSGATITIPSGDTKVIYSDGAGSGGKMVDAFASLSVVDLKVQDDLTVTDDVAIGGLATVGGTLGVTGIATFTDDIIIGDGKTIGSASDVDAMTIASNGQITLTQTLIGTALDISGDIDVDGTTNLDVTNIVGDLTVTGDTITFTSANANDPALKLINTTNDTDGAELQIRKDKGAAGADGDIVGLISFIGDDAAQQQHIFAKMAASIVTAADGSEGGKLAFGVASHDAEFQNGLVLQDGNAEDEIDVTIGNGAASVTTIAGTLTSSGNVGIGTSSPQTGLHVEGTDGSTNGTIRLTATGVASSGLAMDANGLNFGTDTGGFVFKTGATANDPSDTGTNRMAITSAGATVTGELVSTSFKATNFINIQVDDAELYLTNTANNRFRVFARDASNNLSLKRFDGSSVTTDVTFDSSGNVLVGTTDTSLFNNTSGSGIMLAASGRIDVARVQDVCSILNRTGASDGSIIDFKKNGTTVGSISVTGSNTAYNTSSDYRLKTDAQPMSGASARVQALNPVNFKWIADGTRVDGFLAHEAQAVVPECVTGTKDAMKDEEYQVSAATGDIYTPATDAYVDEDGNDVDAVDEIIHSANAEHPETLEDGKQWRETTPEVIGTRSVPDMQGIDQSKIVPLLVAALQEALARLTALENA